MRLEILMGNKISEKFVLTNEGSLIVLFFRYYVALAHIFFYDRIFENKKEA
jgi:hypothetical protein